MRDHRGRLVDNSWVEFVGDDDPEETTPKGAVGQAYYFSPINGGYLTSLEGGGSGYFEEEALREIPPPRRDPRDRAVWVELVNGEWELHVGGVFGPTSGRFDALEDALVAARHIGVEQDRPVVWLNETGREVVGRWEPEDDVDHAS